MPNLGDADATLDLRSATGYPKELEQRYQVLQELGRGGMGIVYKAVDRETGEVVALKVLKPEIAEDAHQLERFKNEVRLARRITHKNVCRIHEFGRLGATAFISMEYVEGRSLRPILEKSGKLPLEEGLRVTRQICAGLREAHQQGIAHRDLKPENLMLDAAGQAKIMDFGIARRQDSTATISGSIVGTPAYMSPEQAEGKPADHRSDLYSLGLILYEIFTGKAPFKGDSVAGMILKQIRETPPPMRQLEPALPTHLKQAVVRAVEKDPAHRFQSVAEFEEALEGRAPVAPAPVFERKPRLPKASFAAAAVVLLAAAAGAYLWTRSRAEGPIEVSFRQHTLANRLRVILSEDHFAPTVSMAVTYNVGAGDERPGRTGLAHLFEHMMFEGSENVGKGEHSVLVENHGGNSGNRIAPDFSGFFQTLAANQLELGLFLEADRMRSPRINQASLDTQRHAVIEEVHRGRDNRPYGRTFETALDVAFDNFPYKHSGSGVEEDLNAVAVSDLAEFFRVYYAPSNAVLSLVGDFRSEAALSLVRKHFDPIPRQPLPAGPDVTDPPQQGERRKTIDDAFARSPLVNVHFKLPPRTSPDWPPLRVTRQLLVGGRSARLHQKLFREQELVTNVSGGVQENRGTSLGSFNFFPRPQKDIAQVEKAAYDELNRLQREL